MSETKTVAVFRERDRLVPQLCLLFGRVAVSFPLPQGNVIIFRLACPLSHFLLTSVVYNQTSKTFIIEHFALNKSSLLLKIQKQNTQTLQLFTMLIKIESIDKSY